MPHVWTMGSGGGGARQLRRNTLLCVGGVGGAAAAHMSELQPFVPERIVRAPPRCECGAPGRNLRHPQLFVLDIACDVKDA